jgi:hypothetical protein
MTGVSWMPGASVTAFPATIRSPALTCAPPDLRRFTGRPRRDGMPRFIAGSRVVQFDCAEWTVSEA